MCNGIREGFMMYGNARVEMLQVRNKLFQSVVRQELDFFDQRRSGDTIVACVKREQFSGFFVNVDRAAELKLLFPRFLFSRELKVGYGRRKPHGRHSLACCIEHAELQLNVCRCLQVTSSRV